MSITVKLANESHWMKYQPQNEMMSLNRRKPLFPSLEYKIEGLERDALYTATVHLLRLEQRRLSYTKRGTWEPRGMTKVDFQKLTPPTTKRIMHMFDAVPGEQWMRTNISFNFLRITNNPRHENDHTIIVQSMHKYIPVLTLTKVGEQEGHEFKFPVTDFIAVTTYQSPMITELKTKLNKYSRNDYKSGKHKRAHKDTTASGPAAKMPNWAFPAMMPFLMPFQLNQLIQFTQMAQFQYLAMQNLSAALQENQQSEVEDQPIDVETSEDEEDEIIDVESLEDCEELEVPEKKIVKVEEAEKKKNPAPIGQVLKEVLEMIR